MTDFLRTTWGKAMLVVALVLTLTVLTSARTPGRSTAAATAFSFGATGDTGATSNTIAVVDAARSAGVSVFFNLGDASYSQISPESAWCSLISGHAGTPMSYELIAGNHEDDGPDGLWSNFASCLPDKLGSTGAYAQQYYADYPASSPLVRFIMVSPKLTFAGSTTNWSYRVGTQGYDFVKTSIDGARAAGVPFVVVGMHMYCLSMVDYPCAASPDLMNLLVAKHVDLYLQAHDHGYARSKQLGLQGSCTSIALGSFNPDCVVSADPGSSYVSGAGTVLATIGAGGRSLNKENPDNAQAPYFQTFMGSNNNPTYGFLKVDVSPTALNGTFVRGSGGTYTDTFTIIRAPDPTPTPTPTPTPGGTVTLTPVADTWVGGDAPTTAHGADKALYTDSSPTKATYLKYDLSTLAGATVVNAQLKITTTSSAYSGSPGVQTVRSLDDTAWSEATMTYSTRPPVGSALRSVSGTSPATTYTITLPASLVQGGVGGLFALAIDTTGDDAFYIGSRESATPPQLVLALG